MYRLKKLSVILFLVGLGFLAVKTSFFKSAATEIPMKNAVALQSELPLYFIENQGQASGDAKFLARGMKESLSFTPTGIDFRLPKNQHFALKFKNASKNVQIRGEAKQTAEINYLIGKKSDWKTHIPTFGEIVYQGIYPGIDLVIKGHSGSIKYEFHVAKKARPDDILLAYENVEGLKVNDGGDLVIQGALGEMKDQKPFIYQDINGERVEVPGKFVVKGKEAYGFELGSYNKDYVLVIDPSLIYSTFVGGASNDVAYDIAIDASGNAYVVGYTDSSTNLATSGAYDTTKNTSDDIFIAKIASDGKSVSWATYLGGNGSEYGYGIAVDSSGQAYITGYTYSTDFPTVSAFQGSHATGSNSDIFITKLNSAGTSILYSSYLGGTSYESGYGIAVDGSGNAYIAGYTSSTGSIAKTGSYDTSHNGNSDIFVSKFNTAASGDSSLVYSTYVGGSGNDIMENGDIAIDSSGNAYVAGSTASTQASATPWPLVGAYDATHNGGTNDMFVFKLNSAGTSLTYSTFVGGSGWDQAYGIAVDGSDQAYVTGKARGGMPTNTTNSSIKSYDPSFNKISSYDDVYVFKLNALGDTILYSTYLGGTYAYYHDRGYDIAVDSSEKVYVCGTEESTAFPTTSDGYDTSQNQDFDWFYTKLDTTVNGSTSLLYSTYLGSSWGSEICYGIAIDSAGNNIYLTGQAGAGNGQNFPTTTGAAKTGVQAQPVDSAVVRFGPNTAPTANAGPDQTNKTVSSTVTLNGTASSDPEGSVLTYSWNQNSGTAVSLSSLSVASPTFIAPDVGGNMTLVFTLTVSDGSLSSSADTVSISVNAKPLANAQTVTTATNTGVAITLSGSDPDNESLTYSIVSNPSHGFLGTLSGTGVTYTPTSNFNGGDSFTFRTNDGYQNSATATVSIGVGEGNDVPVAAAGPDQSNINPGFTVYLSGSGSSDVDGDTLTYAWVQTSGPTATLNSANTAWPYFTARASGNLVFRLIVNDGTINSNADTVIVSVNNVSPVANAGPDASMTAGNSYRLQGSATDTNLDTLTYTWTKLEGPATSLSSTTGQTPTFQTSSLYSAGSIFKFRLTVSDGKGGTATDDVWITLMAASMTYSNTSTGTYTMAPTTNTLTTATVSGDNTVTTNTTVTPTTNTLVYQWSVVSAPTGGTATISDSTAVAPTIDAVKMGSYTVRACVSDGTDQTCSDQLITVPNYVPVIAKSRSLFEETRQGQAINLSSFVSATDSNNDAVTFNWAQKSGTGTLSIVNGQINCATSKCKRGSYVLETTAVDTNGGTAVDQVTVTMPNNNPVPPAASQIVFKGAESNVRVSGDEIKYQTFKKEIVLENVVFNDDDDDNLAYTWSLSKPYGLSAPNAFGFTQAGTGSISLSPRIPGTYNLTASVNDGYGGTVAKVFTIVVPVPEIPEEKKEIEVVTTEVSEGIIEVSGTVSSPVIPSVTVNGVEAIVSEEVTDATASLMRAAVRHTEGDDDGYETYAFQASDVPSDSADVAVEVYADMDGEKVSLISRSVTKEADDATGSGDTTGSDELGGGGIIASAVVGGACNLSASAQSKNILWFIWLLFIFPPVMIRRFLYRK